MSEPIRENPWLSARRLWNDHVGRAIAARNLWQAVALLSLVIAAAAVGTLAQVATRSRFVPYVVEVDRAGEVEAVRRAAQMAPASRAVIEAQIEKFITLSRRVTTDIALQRAAVRGVFAMLALGDPALSKMEEHLTVEAHPVQRAEQVTVTTEVISILPQTGESWQVDWLEYVYDRHGAKKDSLKMRAVLQVYQSEPVATSETALKDNPLSVYIRDFHWGLRKAREVRQ